VPQIFCQPLGGHDDMRALDQLLAGSRKPTAI